MSKYYCSHCNYDAKIKGNYDRHLKTKKHKMLAEDTKKYECKYCDKNFKHHSSLCKHIKYTCKKNKDEEMDKQLALRDKKIEILQNQIDELTNKLKIQNII